MSEPHDNPDRAFSLPAPVDEPQERAEAVERAIAVQLAAAGPTGWTRLEAVFSLTVAQEYAQVYYTVGEASLRGEPSVAVLGLARELRSHSAELSDGPWWRCLLTVVDDGRHSVEYDRGENPFAEPYLMAPESYRSDLRRFPRNRLPVWLAAYLGHDNRQVRTPRDAATSARADSAAGVRPVRVERGLPPLLAVWARWAALSAAFVAVGSSHGPRIGPSVGWFEGTTRSGSTIYLLPGDRAVLSGGQWNAPSLDAVYNHAARMPDFYAGAPAWVANMVLNPRAATGLLSFCYWWDGEAWYHGDSPAPDQFADAVPAVHTSPSTAAVIAALAAEEPDNRLRRAAGLLVSHATAGSVTRAALAAVFDEASHDLDSAMYQFTVAGLTTPDIAPLAHPEAISMVRDWVLRNGLDTTGYPLDELVAERVLVGWLVYVPAPVGQLSFGRTLFYVADDGLVERSTSSIAPASYLPGFEQRFRQRTKI